MAFILIMILVFVCLILKKKLKDAEKDLEDLRAQMRKILEDVNNGRYK
ncbi:unnamed protein product [marine sediment metagenome]|uniref:Uncharacterized protein n=1 Tax=marine sediment metagenome TaxID=412755 RepID=X1HNM1_9ZZZZ